MSHNNSSHFDTFGCKMAKKCTYLMKTKKYGASTCFLTLSDLYEDKLQKPDSLIQDKNSDAYYSIPFCS